MNRREAIKRFSILLASAGVVTAAGPLIVSCNDRKSKEETEVVELTKDEQKYLTELVDVFIPETEIPGAKSVGVDAFVAMMLADCYENEVIENFRNCLQEINKMSIALHEVSFNELDLDAKEQVIKDIVTISVGKNAEEKESFNSFFRLAFELTCLGYYTSEVGATQVMEYVHIPGRYEACIPLENQPRTWSI